MPIQFIGMHRRSLLASAALATSAFACPAQAQFMLERGYVGPSYLVVPGLKGDAKEAANKESIRVAAHYWKSNTPMRDRGQRAAAAAAAASAGGGGAQPGATAAPRSQLQQGAPAAPQSSQASPPGQRRPDQVGQAGQGGQQAAQDFFGRRRAFLTVPGAPRKGEGSIVLAVDKASKGLAGLMKICQDKSTVPEMIHSASALRSRTRLELGPRPGEIPEYFDFKFKNVQIVDCPVVEGAPEQALVVKFSDIEWLNWQSEANGAPVKLQQPAAFQLTSQPKPTGATRAWVVTWIALAHDVSDDQCPVMNSKPSEADYYRYLPPQEAEKERAALSGKGGPNFENGQMGLRGPSRLNVTYLPGIVPDPGMAEPQTKVARGLNLDGDDGSRRKHKNYVSADGKVTGIDNQLYTVQGCVQGWQGHKGFLLQFANNQLRDGEMSILVEISGIDDEKNDDRVFVTLRYSSDAMVKNGAGDRILADYTFDAATKPELAYYTTTVPGRIVDGIVTTDPLKAFRLNLGIYGIPPELKLAEARMRFELKPDGTLKGVLGGYRDWHEIGGSFVSSSSEFYHGFQQPALYNALKRNADGMKNPVTGQYDGISTAYDIEGVPAFIAEAPPRIAESQETLPQEANASTAIRSRNE